MMRSIPRLYRLGETSCFGSRENQVAESPSANSEVLPADSEVLAANSEVKPAEFEVNPARLKVALVERGGDPANSDVVPAIPGASPAWRT
jgi:hypothetical protein